MNPMAKEDGVVGANAMCDALSETIGRRLTGTKAASAIVSEFQSAIRMLGSSLIEIEQLLCQYSPEILAFEREHQDQIRIIINSCLSVLGRLALQLDDRWWQEASASDETRIVLNLALKSSTVEQLINHLKIYIQVLKLSRLTLSLTGLSAVKESENEIGNRVRQLTTALPRLHPRRSSVELDIPFLSNTNERKTKGDFPLVSEIESWKLSAAKVLAAVSSYYPDRVPRIDIEPKICAARNADIAETVQSESVVDFLFDNDQEALHQSKSQRSDYNYSSAPISLSHFEQNQKAVDRLRSCGCFANGSKFSRECIDCEMLLATLGQAPSHSAEQADMQEHLVEILLNTGMEDDEAEAIEILKRLLADELRQPTEALDQDRRCRLYHRLGSIYMLSSPSQHNQSERLKRARTCLLHAFNGRREMIPMSSDLVLESGDLLVRAMHLDRDFESARGYMEWMRRELRPDLSSPNSHEPSRYLLNRLQGSQAVGTAPEEVHADEKEGEELVNAYMWSQSKGFDIDAINFEFEACSISRGTSPLHLAVFEENLRIIRPMIGYVASLEHRDCDQQTPLLLACHTRNHKVVKVLLENGSRFIDANGAVICDYRGKSALHLCQDKKGGVRVAKLLIKYAQRLNSPSPSDQSVSTFGSRPQTKFLQAADDTGRTALLMAVENGNEEMVQVLLEAGASPDLTDNHGKSALYIACERGDERVARQLLRPINDSVDPNFQGPSLCTPLMAVLENVPSIAVKMAITRMLLEAGADPHIVDGNGRAALMIAKQSGFSSQLVRLMQEAEAPVSRVQSSIYSRLNSHEDKSSNHSHRLKRVECRHQGKGWTFGWAR